MSTDGMASAPLPPPDLLRIFTTIALTIPGILYFIIGALIAAFIGWSVVKIFQLWTTCPLEDCPWNVSQREQDRKDWNDWMVISAGCHALVFAYAAMAFGCIYHMRWLTAVSYALLATLTLSACVAVLMVIERAFCRLWCPRRSTSTPQRDEEALRSRGEKGCRRLPRVGWKQGLDRLSVLRRL